MDNVCGICMKPAEQLFETGKEGVFACFKCQPLVPEVTMEVEPNDPPVTIEVEVETPMYCNICDKTFQKNLQYQNHIRNHRAERRFVCTYCNKAFSQSNNLRAHLRIHTNERPYKCNECGKAFTQVTNLNNHIRLHTGERPFVCPEPGCNKAYAQVTNLNQHKKRHVNGRPVESTYDCNICGEQFEQRNHMYLHRKEAHADLKLPVRSAVRPQHVCRICDMAFSTERQLVRHVGDHLAGGATNAEPIYKCVFENCGQTFASPAQHTEHLLRVHQLRVTGNFAPARSSRGSLGTLPMDLPHQAPIKRGRPPKIVKFETVDIKDAVFDMEVKPEKEESQFFPKLKIQSLFQ